MSGFSPHRRTNSQLDALAAARAQALRRSRPLLKATSRCLLHLLDRAAVGYIAGFRFSPLRRERSMLPTPSAESSPRPIQGTGGCDWSARDQRHLLHACHDARLQADGIIWQSGRGATLIDVEGREFLDGISGLWNVLVGHGRQELAETAAQQMTELAYASNYAGSSNKPAIVLAERLAALCYSRINRFYFTTSGAEANEAAIKTARYFWKRNGQPGKTHVIARRGNYHGTTLAALSATGMDKYLKAFEPRMPGFSWIETPPHASTHRLGYAANFDDVPEEVSGQAAAAALKQEILRLGSHNVAAFLAEPIVGVGGVYLPPRDYWPAVREICDRYDVLLIADEVITAFGRLGEWFALQQYGIEPDIVTFAKGITSGYMPLGGMGVNDEVGACVASGAGDTAWLHAATYSGHAASCAVALANLDILQQEDLLARAKQQEKLLADAFAPLAEHKLVKQIRGCGLLWALALDDTSRPELGFELLAAARARGLFSRARGDLFHLAPCLTIEAGQLRRCVTIISEALAAIE